MTDMENLSAGENQMVDIHMDCCAIRRRRGPSARWWLTEDVGNPPRLRKPQKSEAAAKKDPFVVAIRAKFGTAK